MYSLSSLMYGISWNNGECRSVTAKDLERCKCAYKMAEFMWALNKMKRYQKWINNHLKDTDTEAKFETNK